MKRNRFLIGVVAMFAFVGVVFAEPSKALAVSDLTIQKTGSPSIVNTGEKVTYVVVIQNTSDKQLTDFKVRDVLPKGFSYVEGSTVSNVGEPTVNDRILIWKVNKLKAGVAPLTIVYKAIVGSSVENGKYLNEAYALGASDNFKVEVKKVKVVKDDIAEEETSNDSQENTSNSETNSGEETESDLESESKEAIVGISDEKNNSDDAKKEDTKEDTKKDSEKDDKKLTKDELKTGQSVVKDKKDKDNEEGDSSFLIFVLVILFFAAIALTYFEMKKLRSKKEGVEGEPHLWE